jgi:glycosyltransferase involved in cell wall biosynthesis
MLSAKEWYMKILFVDPVEWDYDTKTPYIRPLGGTQSAIAYLAKALADAGNEVAILNGGTEPSESDGVRILKMPCPTPILNMFDVVVLSTTLALILREIGCTRPLVLWTGHASNQPAVAKLADPAERSAYSGLALVSQWQANEFYTAFGLDPAAPRIMRNAVSPGFLQINPTLGWLSEDVPPVLAYTSTPYRGLDILLLSFAAIRAQLPGAALRVFSSMGIYDAGVPDEFSALYELARVLPGVTYVGPLSQPRLAEAMADVDIWAYPCIFAETSCISAMEAMASGAMMITNSLGALPETTAGFAHYAGLADSGKVVIPGQAATRYATRVLQVVAEARAAPERTAQTIASQIDFARTHYTWSVRAAQWTAWLKEIA